MRTDERVIDDVLVLSIRERRVDARSAPALKERIASVGAEASSRMTALALGYLVRLEF